MKRLQLLVLGALVLAALILSSAASAAIVPQSSIAGIKLGMSESAVKAKLGAPLRVRSGSNLFGHWRRLVYGRVTVSFQNGNKATSLTTKSSLEKTANGVGVGSTLAQLRVGLRGEQCKREFGVHHCWIGRWEPGRAITDFRLKNSRVTQVALAYVLD
ncbi:MAG TPA: hypothetical protein VII83_05275 [Gaiellaceae bacterium]